MYKNRARDGKNNVSGVNIAMLRKAQRPRLSQNKFSHQLQILGVDLDKNAIQRIESGARFVTDIELKTIAQALGVSADDLLLSPQKINQLR